MIEVSSTEPRRCRVCLKPAKRVPDVVDLEQCDGLCIDCHYSLPATQQAAEEMAALVLNRGALEHEQGRAA